MFCKLCVLSYTARVSKALTVHSYSHGVEVYGKLPCQYPQPLDGTGPPSQLFSRSFKNCARR